MPEPVGLQTRSLTLAALGRYRLKSRSNRAETGDVKKLGPDYTPFEALGGASAGEEKIRALVEDFYDAMGEHEPALARLHPCEPEGRVDQGSRDRFALFLIGWLGGPQHYMERHGHPRLRMRHGKVPVNSGMRDAWMRSMVRALDKQEITGDVRGFMEAKLGEVADFLRNQPG